MCYIKVFRKKATVFFYCCLFLISTNAFSQQNNLIINNSFETFEDSSIFGFCLIDNCVGWYSPNQATSDYLNSYCQQCFICDVPLNFAGHQNPKSMNAYAGIITWSNSPIISLPEYKEYLSTKLIRKLVQDRKYFFSCYVSLGDTFTIACNNFGVYLSKDSVFGNYPENLNFSPQISNNINSNPLTDKQNWMEFKGCFSATGGEQFLTLGNFVPSNLSDTTNVASGILNSGSYYYIDDVSLYEVRGLNNTEDTTICSATGFTKTLRVDTAYHNVLWSTGDTLHQISVNTGGKYWVTSISPYCGVVTDTINIKLINPNNLNFSLGNDTLVCGAFTKTLKTNIVANKYLWNTTDTSNQISTNQTGTYWLTCQTECGVFSDTIIITAATIPNNIIIQNDTTIYVGDTIVLNALSGLQQYEWGTTTGFITNSQLQGASYTNVIAAQAAISLSAFTNDGCIIEDTLIVITKAKPTEQLPIVYPTILFANKEKLVFKNLPQGASISIYNSMGQIVFEKNNYYNEFPSLPLLGGTGGGLSDGIYYYRLVFGNETVVKKFVVLK